MSKWKKSRWRLGAQATLPKSLAGKVSRELWQYLLEEGPCPSPPQNQLEMAEATEEHDGERKGQNSWDEGDRRESYGTVKAPSAEPQKWGLRLWKQWETQQGQSEGDNNTYKIANFGLPSTTLS